MISQRFIFLRFMSLLILCFVYQAFWCSAAEAGMHFICEYSWLLYEVGAWHRDGCNQLSLNVLLICHEESLLTLDKNTQYSGA